MALSLDTQYFWRVRSRAVNLTSDWITGNFITIGASPQTSSHTTTSDISKTEELVTRSSIIWIVVVTSIITAVVMVILMAFLMLFIARKKKVS